MDSGLAEAARALLDEARMGFRGSYGNHYVVPFERIDALRAALEAPSICIHGINLDELCKRCAGTRRITVGITHHGERNEIWEEPCPDCTGGAAPLSGADARRLANARHAYSLDDVPWIIGLLDSAHARIAELERERDALRDANERMMADLTENAAEREARRAKLDERNANQPIPSEVFSEVFDRAVEAGERLLAKGLMEKLLAEIERQALSTNFLIWTTLGRKSNPRNSSAPVECICITKDALREALAPTCRERYDWAK